MYLQFENLTAMVFKVFLYCLLFYHIFYKTIRVKFSHGSGKSWRAKCLSLRGWRELQVLFDPWTKLFVSLPPSKQTYRHLGPWDLTLQSSNFNFSLMSFVYITRRSTQPTLAPRRVKYNGRQTLICMSHLNEPPDPSKPYWVQNLDNLVKTSFLLPDQCYLITTNLWHK